MLRELALLEGRAGFALFYIDLATGGLRSLKSYPDPIIIPSPRKWQWDFARHLESLLVFYFFIS